MRLRATASHARWIKAGLAFLLMLVLFPCMLNAGGKSDSKSRSFIVKITAIEDSPGLWSAPTEYDQFFEGVVVKTSDNRFPVGTQLRIGVPLISGNPLFSSRPPQFDESKVSAGKTLRIIESTGCVETRGEKELRVDPSCISLTRM
jgi:hypothetical protein